MVRLLQRNRSSSVAASTKTNGSSLPTATLAKFQQHHNQHHGGSNNKQGTIGRSGISPPVTTTAKCMALGGALLILTIMVLVIPPIAWLFLSASYSHDNYVNDGAYTNSRDSGEAPPPPNFSRDRFQQRARSAAAAATRVRSSHDNTDSAPSQQKAQHSDSDLHDETKPDMDDPDCFLSEDCIRIMAQHYLARSYPNRTDQRWCLLVHPDEFAHMSRYQRDNLSLVQTSRTKRDALKQQQVEGEDNQQPDAPLWRGLLLVKVPKSSSSTLAGVLLRIAVRNACAAVQWMHRPATDYAQRQASQSFLLTSVRNPSHRAISSLFFHVISRQRGNVTADTVTDRFILQYLRQYDHPHQGTISTGQGGFQLRYTSTARITEYSAWTPSQPTQVQNPAHIVHHVANVMQTYDFIAVTERLDESVVAMALLMGIPIGDVLVTQSKVAGSQYHLMHLGKGQFKCQPTVKSFVSPRIQEYFDSAEWKAQNYGDALLHAAAWISLDMTIDEVIGRDRFSVALAEYHSLQQLEIMQCAPNVEFPCSNDGHPQPDVAAPNCYLRYYDFGCGYPCIDQIVDAHEDQQQTQHEQQHVLAVQQKKTKHQQHATTT